MDQAGDAGNDHGEPCFLAKALEVAAFGVTGEDTDEVEMIGSAKVVEGVDRYPVKAVDGLRCDLDVAAGEALAGWPSTRRSPRWALPKDPDANPAARAAWP